MHIYNEKYTNKNALRHRTNRHTDAIKSQLVYSGRI